MSRGWIISRIIVVLVSAGFALRAQVALGAAEVDVTGGRAAVITEIAFSGLRRISPEALKNQMATHCGDALNAERLDRDVRALARTGWFADVRADVASASRDSDTLDASTKNVRLTFYVPESPFLTGLQFTGSHLLSRQQIDKVLAERKLTPKLGEPANPAALFRIAREIETVLADLGHPHARVQIQQEESPQSTVRVRFEISDGPHLPVGRVTFSGHPGMPPKVLQQQMHKVNPDAWFASLRSKDSFTQEAFEEDRRRLLTYYQNHGYPEAHIGTANIAEYEKSPPWWLPWQRTADNKKLEVTIPVQAGHLYRTGPVQASPALLQAAGIRGPAQTSNAQTQTGRAFSAQEVENLRRAWEIRLRTKARQNVETFHDVEAARTLDSEAGTVRVRFDLSSDLPYTVRRLEFRGIQHFPDRYFRRRIGLKEGAPLDQRALEAGLARLTRTGYFKPIKKEDIRIEPNESARTVDVTIRVEELGKQRFSMMGGRGQFGSTLGIAYTLFNLFDRDELLTSKIEGGPEILELALGFAKEGFLGSRGSLALSLFNTFVRPRLTGSVKGPFFGMRTEGVSADYSYALTPRDVLSANYSLAYSDTSYSPTLPAGLSGLPTGDIHAKSSSSSVGVGWTHDAGNRHIVLADSVSGGWLGGTENLVRSKVEYGQIFRDPLFNPQNAWAFRTTFSGVASYSGPMPLTARWFSGDEFVRGLREGELGPQALVASVTPSGATHYSATPAGSNLIVAENAEYRVRLRGGTEASVFFDAGSGLLLPNWLGQSRPAVFDSTNWIVHGSTGVELRWTLPGIGVPLRVYYALNVLRLNRSVLLPDNSLLRLHNRFAVLGWGLGSLF